MANNNNYFNPTQNNVFGALQQVINNENIMKVLTDTLGPQRQLPSSAAFATRSYVSENETAFTESLIDQRQLSNPVASATRPYVSENETELNVLAQSLALQNQYSSPQVTASGSFVSDNENLANRNLQFPPSQTTTTLPPGTSRVDQRGQIQQHISQLFRPRNAKHVIGPKYNISSRRKRSSKRLKKEDSTTVSSTRVFNNFRKTVILLGGPSIKSLPKGEARKLLFKKGFVIDEVNFEKSWSASQVLDKIKSCFHDILSPGVKLELLNSVGSCLLPPKLENANTVLDGEFLHRIWKQKPVYVRPSVDLLTGEEKVNHDLPRVSSDADSSSSLPEYDLTPKNMGRNLADDDSSKINGSIVSLGEPSDSTYSKGTESKQNTEFILMQTNTFDDQTCPSDFTKGVEDKPTISTAYDKYLELYDDETLNSEGKDDVGLCTEERNEVIVSDMENIALQSILTELASQIQDDQSYFISVNRKSFLECALRAFKRPSFKPEKKFNICFTDNLRKSASGTTKQETFDAGGPTREFLRILVKEVVNSHVFTGPENARTLNSNSSAREKDLYFFAGRAFALSLVHGGLGPRCISKITFDSLVVDPIALQPSLDDISDYELRASLAEISNCKDLLSLQDLAEKHSQLRLLAGSTKPILKIGDKEHLMKDLLYFCVFTNTAEPRHRFIEGLKTLGVHEKMVQFPNSFKAEFCYDGTEITASKLISLFSDINYSKEHTMKFDVECKVLQYFMDYAIDWQEGLTRATVKDLLIFATGSEDIPPLGFDITPSIEFVHPRDNTEEERKLVSRLPHASTCALKIYLPVIHESFESFCNAMDFAMCDSAGFGMA